MSFSTLRVSLRFEIWPSYELVENVGTASADFGLLASGGFLDLSRDGCGMPEPGYEFTWV